MAEVKSLEEIRKQIGEDRAKDGQEALDAKGRPEAEGACIAEIWLMPSGQVQVRCEPKRRFTVEKALIMSFVNMRREITLELVAQMIKDELAAYEKTRGGSKIWQPGEPL